MLIMVHQGAVFSIERSLPSYGQNLKQPLDSVPIRVWKDGTVTVTPDLKPLLTHGEYVTLSNCTVRSNLREFVLSAVHNISKKSTCTEMVHFPSYKVKEYSSPDSLVLPLKAADTFTINENISIFRYKNKVNLVTFQKI